jgi:hypothetical protein
MRVGEIAGYLCAGTCDDLTGQDVSMRDKSFRQRIGLA